MRITHKAIISFAFSTLIATGYVVTAKAQTAVYSTLIFTNRETSIATQNDYFASAGIGFGLYSEGYQIRRVNMGLDFRGTYSPSVRFGLAGPRAELLSRRELVRPYVEFLIGAGTDANAQGLPIGHLYYEAVGGVDVPMGRIDYRLLEFGVGKTLLNNTNTIGESYTGGNLWEVTASSGITYRF